MPELPEVETIRRGVQMHVVGRTVTDVEVLHPRAIRRHLAGPVDFAARLQGKTFTAARRRGKYLWLDAAGPGDAVAAVVHLGMSGQLIIAADGADDPIHLRVRVHLDGDQSSGELRFIDQRTFGGWHLDDYDRDITGGVDDALPASVAHIAPDPFDPLFDRKALLRNISRRHTEIKRALLDQTLISGVGNIYADESLWRAKLHGTRATDKISRAKLDELVGHVTDVMAEAIDVGGTSFDELYVNVNGESGYFDRSLNAYGREGEPCRRCGRPMRREAFMNRSSYSCPSCQRKPR
ncbi:bifunctional DNA-formamidopyrimidine glycosylase/DNA-(apurinic or apyrimidinic site) lyase [Gordonia sp. TBRC 11910]|uniref:Formamidopyrimidine-DNA glycosylase n=1 Tax=Gordonia asplenii TaxID=2725283 RepID=A0A848KS58_9ACTN|nr:bifunctional DNA-formamidopyrimidine glycosylase/DNA-(apurinic or apyrimidinic site) lyase [Gordonia asplenii]NMN99704.1 bifunctional DNA-formamidopyrimidine glycosylase/DNA-(apurinic or apyrimidinic site) lyase [Gordonia asplenii]